ncbi:MAG: RluA family pseudouridine synthase [Bacteroidia bacterium]
MSKLANQHTPTIIFEDNHLLIVHKPPGMLSQGDVSGDLCVFEWAKAYIKKAYNKPGNVYVALLHRLDRPTGGLIALAKTSKAAGRISKDFEQRKVQKTYYAITEQTPEEQSGTLVHFMKNLPGKNIMRAYYKQLHQTKRAELHYRVLQTRGNRALVEVKPVTGRKHQIRVQLSSLNCTIVGDVKYGKSDFNKDKSICLLAGKLTFEHPVKKEQMTFVANWPKNEAWTDFKNPL